MVQFPSNFVQLDRYPGYYWNIDDKQLYTLKQSGVLKPMVMKKAFRGYTRYGWVNAAACYRVSVNGNHKSISYQWLCSIKVPQETQVVPVLPPDNKCKHEHQLWNIQCTSGHCRDCGTALQGNQV